MDDPRFFIYKGVLYLTSISHLRLAAGRDGRRFKAEDKPAMAPLTRYETYGMEDPRITKLGSKYETSGMMPNVVFHNGLVDNGDGTLFLYYGAAETRPAAPRSRSPTSWIHWTSVPCLSELRKVVKRRQE